MHLLHSKKIVIATHNIGKLREINDLIAPYGFENQSAIELGLPVPKEIGKSFEENAYIKALSAAEITGGPALSDDSGLEVDALAGAPGIHTAAWAEQPDGTRNFLAAMKKVESRLQKAGAKDETRRTGRFICILCIAWPDGYAEYFKGTVEGRLVWPPRGLHGFGFDSMFQPVGYKRTFGEMHSDEEPIWKDGNKKGLSHRVRAFEHFAKSRLILAQG